MKKFFYLSLVGLAACSNAHAITEMFSFSGVNLAIPDGPSYGAADVQGVSSSILSITSVRVTLNISGDYNGDL